MPKLTTETKIVIPLALVGSLLSALLGWVLLEVKDLGQRIARIEGRLESKSAAIEPLDPAPHRLAMDFPPGAVIPNAPTAVIRRDRAGEGRP